MTTATQGTNAESILHRAEQGIAPSEAEAIALADFEDTRALANVAARLRDQGFLNLVTYSRKIFIPLTHLCRDVCHYCTFAQTPSKLDNPYMELDAVLEVARHGAEMGCKEALFTLGEKPELRYRAAREWLAEHGYTTTLEYLHDAAKAVFEETGLLPHLNPGNMTPEEVATLRPVSPSMGIMLESASDRLTEKGMPHYGSPDKVPAVRLQTLADAGAARIPFTTGILIGIGETRRERIESLLGDSCACTSRYGHIQEIIVQNFRAKPGTKMRSAPEPDLDELLVDHRHGPHRVRARNERSGAAQPEPRRAEPDRRRRHQRLGRRLAAHAGFRQPGSPLAAPGRTGPGDRASPARYCTNG